MFSTVIKCLGNRLKEPQALISTELCVTIVTFVFRHYEIIDKMISG